MARCVDGLGITGQAEAVIKPLVADLNATAYYTLQFLAQDAQGWQ